MGFVYKNTRDLKVKTTKFQNGDAVNYEHCVVPKECKEIIKIP